MAAAALLGLGLALAALQVQAEDPANFTGSREVQQLAAVAGADNLTEGVGYSNEEALTFAYLARASFCGHNLPAWDCGPCAQRPGMQQVRTVSNFQLSTHAYVGLFRGQYVITFRGTDFIHAWVQDLKSLVLVDWEGCSFHGQTCRVGSGFLENYRTLEDDIRRGLSDIGCTKSSPIVITGHSLGGALAMVAMFDLKRRGYNVVRGYTFGQPRVGNQVFAEAFGETLGQVPMYRLTRFDDPFPLVPLRPNFQHAGTEVYFWGPGPSDYKLCPRQEDPACSLSKRFQVPLMWLQCAVNHRACGHLKYFSPADPFLLDCSPEPNTVLFP